MHALAFAGVSAIAAVQAGAVAGTPAVDPAVVLAAFGLNIAAVIGAAWRISGTLTRLDVTLSQNLKDVGKLQSELDELKKDVNALHRIRRTEHS